MAERRLATNFGIPFITDLTAEFQSAAQEQPTTESDLMKYIRARGSRRWSRRSLGRSRRLIFSSSDSLKI